MFKSGELIDWCTKILLIKCAIVLICIFVFNDRKNNSLIKSAMSDPPNWSTPACHIPPSPHHTIMQPGHKRDQFLGTWVLCHRPGLLVLSILIWLRGLKHNIVYFELAGLGASLEMTQNYCAAGTCWHPPHQGRQPPAAAVTTADSQWKTADNKDTTHAHWLQKVGWPTLKRLVENIWNQYSNRWW